MLDKEQISRFPCDVIEQKFSVPFEYPVFFTNSLFDVNNPLLMSVIIRKNENRQHRVKVYIDSNVNYASKAFVSSIEKYFECNSKVMTLVSSPQIINGGESAKNGWDNVKKIMNSIGTHHMCRQSFIMVIGGGGLLDMVGFASALVHRGLRLIRIPTTVLSQNDAGVGVKNGMNEHKTKNFVGAFAPPFAVINDSNFLTTLEDKDWIGGIAEAFKVALIKDADFFSFLCDSALLLRNRNMAIMEKLIKRCAELHLDHIRTSGDPFEFGTARPLDFGHWSAHQIETMSQYKIGHGQAVAIGIALDSYYAMRSGFISEEDLDRIISGMTACGLPVWCDLLEKRREDGKLDVLDGIERFREHLGGELTITLPRPIGNKCEIHHIETEIVENGVNFLKQVK